MSSPFKTVCFVCAEAGSFDAFLAVHAARLNKEFSVVLLANGKSRRASALNVRHYTMVIERRIRPMSDLWALVLLARHFSRHRYDIVHSITPKAGLLAMVAATLAGVPLRFHTFTGQVWATKTGFARFMLKNLDRLLTACSTHVLADSGSQADFLAREGVAARSVLTVIGSGSISGVDCSRFRPDGAARRSVRAELDTDRIAVVFLFLGRFNREKGLRELAEAFRRVAVRHPVARLWLVGPDEAGLRPELEQLLDGCRSQVRFVGGTTTPERYMAAADVFCLPSHREGFGSVVIEAAACGCPCVGSEIYGITDAIVAGHTGLLHPVRDVEALAQLLQRMLEEPRLRETLAASALARARRDFDESRLTEGLAAYYRQRLYGPVPVEIETARSRKK